MLFWKWYRLALIIISGLRHTHVFHVTLRKNIIFTVRIGITCWTLVLIRILCKKAGVAPSFGMGGGGWNQRWARPQWGGGGGGAKHWWQAKEKGLRFRSEKQTFFVGVVNWGAKAKMGGGGVNAPMPPFRNHCKEDLQNPLTCKIILIVSVALLI